MFPEKISAALTAGRRLESVAVTLGTAIFLLLYLWPATVEGQALLPADSLFRNDPVWQAQAPPGFTRPTNPLMVDQIHQRYPWQVFAWRELRQGRLPLWNPYILSGTPFIANDQSAVFYPIRLLLGILPDPLQPGWSAYFALLIAMLSMYGLLRAWHASPPAALCAALAFALGGFAIALLGQPNSNVYVWLPLMVLAADKTITAAAPRRWFLLNAAVIGLQFLGGHAEISFWCLAIWATYGMTAAIRQPYPFRTKLERLGLMGLALVLGSLLGAMQLLPFIELMPQSNFFIWRHAAARQQPWVYPLFWRDSLILLTALLPNIFGNPTAGNWWLGTAFTDYTHVLYAGILPFFLAAAALWLKRCDWRVMFGGISCLVWVGFAFRWPIIDLLRRLPLLNVAAAWPLGYVFCLPVLAGLGLDAIMDEVRAGRRLAMVLASFAALGAAALGGLYGALTLFKGTFMAVGRMYVGRYVYGHPPHPYPLEHYLEQIEERYRQILSLFAPGPTAVYLPLIFALGGALILWFYGRGRLTARAVGVLCVVLTVADLWLFGGRFNATMPPEHVLPWTPALRFLAERQGCERLTSLESMLTPNTGMLFGLADIRGYDVGIGRYAQLLEYLKQNLSASPATARWLDLFSVRYLLTTAALPDSEDLQLLYSQEINIYERRHALPRAYLAAGYEVITDETTLLERLTTSAVLSGQKVLLEKEPPLPATSEFPPSGQIHKIDCGTQTITIEVETPQSAMLVLTDTFYPGWEARIDGKTTTIYRGNYALRAVVVPAGRHSVLFSYEPLSFRLGSWLSLAGIGLFTACCSLVRPKPTSPPSRPGNIV